MKPIQDSGVFKWITESLTPPEGSGASYRLHVSGLIPSIFEKYAKILHRLDGHYKNVDQPLDPDELAILRLPDRSIVHDLVVRKRQSNIAPRVLWKDAACALNLPFAPEINHTWFGSRLRPYPEWPRFIHGPEEGILGIDECGELVRLLGQTNVEQSCFFRLAEIPFIATEQELLFSGTLNQVMPFFIEGGFQFTPEYWWPSDLSWCVCSGYDFDFTIVGGSSNLIESLLRSEILECIEVTPETRVDYLVPVPERDA